MIDDAYNLRTPEQIDLEYDLAGLGSRFLAIMIDSVIQFAVILAVAIVFGFGAAVLGRAFREIIADLPSVAIIVGIAVGVLLIFAVTWGYFILFELVWNGQTPGKRAVGIRVLTVRGEPVTLVHSLVRNLVRIVDMLPTSYTIGVVCMLISKRSQRLGDIAAGTVVVRERKESVPRTLAPLDPALALPPQLASVFTREDVLLARDLLLRSAELPADQNMQLRRQVVATLLGRLAAAGQPAPSDLTDEHLLLGVAALRK